MDTVSCLEGLSVDLRISVTTVRRWLNKYRSLDLTEYLKKERRQGSSSIITSEIHNGLKSRLDDPKNSFNGF